MAKNTIIQNREAWLLKAVEIMTPSFKAKGYEVPKVRVSCGWPSTRALSRTKWHGGECWDVSAADDKINQIFISPRIKKYADVLEVLVHEVCHAAVGLKARHGSVFKKCALAVGLEGKMTSTVAGADLKETIEGWAKTLGEYPHAALSSADRPTKKQTTRMVKCECDDCGYLVRTSREHLEKGAPICPCNNEPMKFDLPDELKDDDGGAE